MAHFTATFWHTISSDVSSNKTDTNNFIFSANITQRIRPLPCLCETQHQLACTIGLISSDLETPFSVTFSFS